MTSFYHQPGIKFICDQGRYIKYVMFENHARESIKVHGILHRRIGINKTEGNRYRFFFLVMTFYA